MEWLVNIVAGKRIAALEEAGRAMESERDVCMDREHELWKSFEEYKVNTEVTIAKFQETEQLIVTQRDYWSSEGRKTHAELDTYKANTLVLETQIAKLQDERDQCAIAETAAKDELNRFKGHDGPCLPGKGRKG